MRALLGAFQDKGLERDRLSRLGDKQMTKKVKGMTFIVSSWLLFVLLVDLALVIRSSRPR